MTSQRGKKEDERKGGKSRCQISKGIPLEKAKNLGFRPGYHTDGDAGEASKERHGMKVQEKDRQLLTQISEIHKHSGKMKRYKSGVDCKDSAEDE